MRRTLALLSLLAVASFWTACSPAENTNNANSNAGNRNGNTNANTGTNRNS